MIHSVKAPSNAAPSNRSVRFLPEPTLIEGISADLSTLFTSSMLIPYFLEAFVDLISAIAELIQEHYRVINKGYPCLFYDKTTVKS